MKKSETQLVRTNLLLPESCRAVLRLVGSGSLSKGCRILAQQAIKTEFAAGRPRKFDGGKGKENVAHYHTGFQSAFDILEQQKKVVG
ncbi:MAG: hypothetical protein HY394_02530 [Candidatus Diapherotrites archaeon]|nr:hypothetical protein [Candidatus Diapherotrites archaeon]